MEALSRGIFASKEHVSERQSTGFAVLRASRPYAGWHANKKAAQLGRLS
jgi:hypothetical protein